MSFFCYIYKTYQPHLDPVCAALDSLQLSLLRLINTFTDRQTEPPIWLIKVQIPHLPLHCLNEEVLWGLSQFWEKHWYHLLLPPMCKSDIFWDDKNQKDIFIMFPRHSSCLLPCRDILIGILIRFHIIRRQTPPGLYDASYDVYIDKPKSGNSSNQFTKYASTADVANEITE